jgi:putative membrane protein
MARFDGFTEAEFARIEAAVVTAEDGTSGEIVPAVIPASDGYAESRERVGLVLAVLGTAAVLLLPDPSGWSTGSTHDLLAAVQHPAGLVVVQALLFLLGFALGRLRPLVRLVVGRRAMSATVRARAEIAFREHGLARTAGRTGVLVFASLLEREVVVLGDAAVAAKLGDEGFRATVDGLVARIHEGRAADGFVEAVERLGAVLATHFPRQAGDVNELPDHLRR